MAQSGHANRIGECLGPEEKRTLKQVWSPRARNTKRLLALVRKLDAFEGNRLVPGFLDPTPEARERAIKGSFEILT
jgi:hypothetical protein